MNLFIKAWWIEDKILIEAFLLLIVDVVCTGNNQVRVDQESSAI